MTSHWAAHAALFLEIAVVGVMAACSLLVTITNSHRQEVLMAQVDDLNAAVVAETQAVADLAAEVASLVPAAPVDLSGAIAGVTANAAGVAQATSDLKAKFPA